MQKDKTDLIGSRDLKRQYNEVSLITVTFRQQKKSHENQQSSLNVPVKKEGRDVKSSNIIFYKICFLYVSSRKEVDHRVLFSHDDFVHGKHLN